MHKCDKAQAPTFGILHIRCYNIRDSYKLMLNQILLATLRAACRARLNTCGASNEILLFCCHLYENYRHVFMFSFSCISV